MATTNSILVSSVRSNKSENNVWAVYVQGQEENKSHGARMPPSLLNSDKNSVLWASPEKHHRLSIARASSALHSAQVFFEPM